MTEPLFLYATVRVTEDREWIDIERRMEDGQKGVFIQVDSCFPQLAFAIVHYLNHEHQRS